VIKLDDSYKVLKRPFDLEVHKKTFVNYLEVILREDGTVEYAVPSHQEKLIAIALEKLKVSREELYKSCPPEYYCDVIAWLCKITGCVSVWETMYIGTCNEAQVRKLQELQTHNLYKGTI
jgi:hypothetical protein